MNHDAFTSRYTNLNRAQKRAVDTIEGPVMVIAGPGTGKTELLSMRVANILKKTDTLPQNILCLTFTESGAAAMRQRLVGLMGPEAYHVAIHTFHSFGTEVINCHPDYFYHGAHFRPADELSSFEVLQEIFEKLPHNNPLASRLNDEFTQLRDTQITISELKKSGLTPDELLKLLDHNDAFIEYANPAITEAFKTPIRSKKALATLEPLRAHLQKYEQQPLPLAGFASLAQVCRDEFEAALITANEQGKTTPITQWRTTWCEKNDTDEVILKDYKRATKLRAVAHIYYEYLVAMQAKTLYDFDDMILRVVHALEVFADLRLNLQEQYQYILVDEFQDTNGAQLRILLNLTENEVNNGRPNILVVGDDDQAIYSFQGAEISNILTFRDQFRDPIIITLTDNYRSAPHILEKSRQVITKGHDRLETHIESLDKTLTPHKPAAKSKVELVELPSKSQEYSWIVEQIKSRLEAGQKASDIAVLTRKHSEMTHLLPYFHHAGIEVTYERRDNVLDLPPILAIEQLALALNDIAEQRFDDFNARLPELLSHPAWRLSPITLWKLGLEAHQSRRHWIEVMLETKGQLKDIGEWLIVAAHKTINAPLEEALDLLLGTYEPQVPEDDTIDPISQSPHQTEGFISPLRDYFFPHNALEKSPNTYISYLHALQLIRRKLRDYQPDEPLYLKDYLTFIELHRKTNTQIVSPRAASQEHTGICLMTAHKSKGLEFDTVFVVNATHSTWGSGARSRGRSISYPANLPLAPAGETNDERLRLFFVAMTRAKRELLLSYALEDLAGKTTLRADFLADGSWKLIKPTINDSPAHQKQAAEHQWHENVLAVGDGDIKKLLKPTLEKYKLSATHLNNFIDVVSGGPQAFLLQNLLRFPQAMTPSAAFGSAIHTTLHRAHAHLSATGTRRPVEDILHDFETALGEQRLNQLHHEHFLQRGSDVLQAFLAARYESFSETAIPERNFAQQGVVVDTAALTGVLDLMLIDEANKSISVIDYKTGKAARRWQGSTDFEKIKLHKYKQQLMFYKILVEHSRDFGGRYSVDSGALSFVEPTRDGEIIQLDMAYDSAELERFKKLIIAIWRRIQALDFPDTSHYEPNYKGILAFEDDIIDEDPK
jgi:DNA helicase II / ATP-dependent DNA helicase PcrA